MLILFLLYSILCSEALLQRSLFFFLQPVAGLTSRVPVRDSRAGAPLIFYQFFMYFNFPKMVILMVHDLLARLETSPYRFNTSSDSRMVIFPKTDRDSEAIVWYCTYRDW